MSVVLRNVTRTVGGDIGGVIASYLSPAERAYGRRAPHFEAMRDDPRAIKTVSQFREKYAKAGCAIDGVAIALALSCTARRYAHALVCERVNGYRVGFATPSRYCCYARSRQGIRSFAST